MIEAGNDRQVYLPPGSWIDYQTGKVYRGAQWLRITPGRVPVVLLAKDHTVIPHAQVAQSTAEMNWKEIELRAFSTDRGAASGLFALPGESLQTLRLESSPQGFALKDDPLRGRVKWQIN